jgi:hypothetical protein
LFKLIKIIIFTVNYKNFAMIPKTIFFIIGLTLIFSCTQNEENNDDVENPMLETDTTDIEIIDTTLQEEDTIVDEVVYDDPEVQEAHEQIVEKYGVQWDFCTCIIKNDSVDKALRSEDLSDADFDILFERSEFIDGKCKGLLIQPNATPDERLKHEKKVSNCLKEHAAK